MARAYAKSRNLRIGTVLPPDIDKSGGTVEREGLRAALHRVREGRSAGIVVAWLDRFSRDAAQAYDLLREFEEAGGRVWAPDAPEDYGTPEGELQLGMFLLVAQYQRKRAKEGFARARERAIAAGIPVNNRDAVGYRRNAERRYELDPDVAPVIREVFERRAAGAGPTELAELLEARGVHTSQGSATWSKPAVQGLIKSRTYLGELRSGPYVNPRAHEPIVDEPTWLAAQHPNPAGPRRRTGGYLLSGILRCASCGYCMQGTHSSRRKRIYRCVRRHAGGLCPAPTRIEAAVADAAVLAEMRGKVYREKSRAGSVDLAPFVAAFEAAERRLQQALEPEAQDALGDRWMAVVRERRREHEEAGRALGEARAQAGASKGGGFWDLFESFDFEDETAPIEERRRMIASVLPAIAVSRDKTLDFGPDPSALSRRGYNRRAKLNPL